MIPLTLMHMMGWNFELLGLLFLDFHIDEFEWVLMTLLILTTIGRDDLHFMLIEGVTLLSYDLDYGWISLILMIFSSLIVISVFIVLVDLEGIYITSWLVLNYFSYEESYYESDFIDIGDHIICTEFYSKLLRFEYTGDLEDGYVDDFEDLRWLYTLTGLFYSCQ